MLDVKDLHKNHPLVLAAHEMVKAHAKHETMLPAIEEVKEEFLIIDSDKLMLMWIAINAKELEDNEVHSEPSE